MPSFGKVAAYTLPNIFAGIGEGLYKRKMLKQLKNPKEEDAAQKNKDRHIGYIMNKIDDPNTPPDLKSTYEDQYFQLTGQRIYSPENPAYAPQDQRMKKVFIPSYQQRTETGYKWVPPTFEKVPDESRRSAVITDPVTEFFNMAVMQDPTLFGKQQLDLAKIKTEEAKAGAYKALEGKREKYQPSAKRDYTTQEEINAIKTRLYAALQEQKNYKSQFGGYIDDQRVRDLQKQIDSDMLRLDQLTGKQAEEEIMKFGERFNKAWDKILELEKRTQ